MKSTRDMRRDHLKNGDLLAE
ncbi:MAG: hypothetical protein AVDCRST_MAG64-81, partial [uncultured Phycisphaerae bacterium]